MTTLIVRPSSPTGRILPDIVAIDEETMSNEFDGNQSRMVPATSEITNDSDKFSVSIDVSNYKTKDIKMSLKGHVLTVEGHQQHKGETSSSQRKFTRRWTLPANTDLSAIRSQISKEGRLNIEAPKTKEISGNSSGPTFLRKLSTNN